MWISEASTEEWHFKGGLSCNFIMTHAHTALSCPPPPNPQIYHLHRCWSSEVDSLPLSHRSVNSLCSADRGASVSGRSWCLSSGFLKWLLRRKGAPDILLLYLHPHMSASYSSLLSSSTQTAAQTKASNIPAFNTPVLVNQICLHFTMTHQMV